MRYRYTNYPYSKKATEWSKAAGLFSAFARWTLIPSLIMTVVGVVGVMDGYTWDKDYTFAVFLFATCVIYLILYYTKIQRYIDKIANEDRHATAMKALNERMQNRYK